MTQSERDIWCLDVICIAAGVILALVIIGAFMGSLIAIATCN